MQRSQTPLFPHHFSIIKNTQRLQVPHLSFFTPLYKCQDRSFPIYLHPNYCPPIQMAITHSSRGMSSDGKREMTMGEFKRWLKKFDADKDGRISRDELREAVYATGGWFAKWKGDRGIKSADANSDGFIDAHEFKNLVAFAEKELSIRIVPY